MSEKASAPPCLVQNYLVYKRWEFQIVRMITLHKLFPENLKFPPPPERRHDKIEPVGIRNVHGFPSFSLGLSDTGCVPLSDIVTWRKRELHDTLLVKDNEANSKKPLTYCICHRMINPLRNQMNTSEQCR